MKTPKTHVLFIENIEWMAVVVTHNALQTTQNQMNCSRRVLTTVLFPEFDSKQGQPLSSPGLKWLCHLIKYS